MWTHRRFTWQVTESAPGAAQSWGGQVVPVLARLMDELPQFYRDAQVSGFALGRFNFSVTISDRDQWWVARRARFLIDELRKETDLPLELLAEEKVKLPPHTRRGKYRLRRLRRKAADG